jgi:hypothetical protein
MSSTFIYRSKSQNNLLHQLLERCGLSDMKAELVLAYTSGRSQHSSEMSWEECQQLIDSLQQNENKMRRKVLSICHQLGWYCYKKPYAEAPVHEWQLQLSNGRPILDMKRINDWCIKYSHVHKSLNEHSEKDLVKLVSQFQLVLKHHLNKAT